MVTQKEKRKGLLSPPKRPNVVSTLKGGGSLITSLPVFSGNSKLLFLNSGVGIKVYSVKTGEFVKALHVKNYEGRIVAINELDDLVLAVTTNGYFLKWEHLSKKPYLSYDLKLRKNWIPSNFHLVPSLLKHGSYDVCVPVLKHQSLHTYFYDIKDLNLLDHPLQKKEVVECTGDTFASSVGGFEDRPILACIGTSGLSIFSIDGKFCRTGLIAGKDRAWTCVRCHGTETVVATGDSTGRVILWRSLVSKGRFTRTVYHWHTLPCQAVALSLTGSSIYSGGSEHVLVKWNVDNPTVRNFLPRLSAEIVHITLSSDNEYIAVATLDNGVTLVGSDYRVSCVVQEIVWRGRLGPMAQLTFDPTTQALVINARPGHIQFYCPKSQKLLYNLDVAGQNYLTQERHKRIYNSEVCGCALSSDGRWLAVALHRAEPLEVYLNIFNYLPSVKSFNLNTSIELAHSGAVECMRFRPGSRTCSPSDNPHLDYVLVTTGQDKKFRFWEPFETSSIQRKIISWGCQSVGFYKDKTCGAASFSEDGSLLAVAFDQTLTIWDADNIHLKTTLTRHALPIRSVEFGQAECCHLVVTATSEFLCTWNLLSVTLLWQVKVAPSLLVADPLSGYIMVYTESNKIYIINPLSVEPVYSKSLSSKCEAALFIPREEADPSAVPWLQQSHLYYIDSNQDLWALECEYEEQKEQKDTWKEESVRDEVLGSMVSHNITGAVQDINVVPNLATSPISQILNSGAHSLPQMSILCSSLLKALLPSRLTSAVISEETVGSSEFTSNIENEESEEDETTTSTAKEIEEQANKNSLKSSDDLLKYIAKSDKIHWEDIADLGDIDDMEVDMED